MSSIAILSDIHSNLVALEAVLKDVRESGAARIVFLGDIVGYGASPAACVEWVRRLGGHCVMGNHDAAIRVCRRPGFEPQQKNWRDDDYAAGLMYSARQLDDGQAGWLATRPYWMWIPGAFLAHGSMDDPYAFNYIEDDDSAAPTIALLADAEEQTGFFGHTHEQKVFTGPERAVEWLDELRFRIPESVPCAVTVGSVGQPRHESDRRASWTLWHPAERVVEFRKVEYDRLKAATQVIEAGLPLDGALRLLAPGEQAMLPA